MLRNHCFAEWFRSQVCDVFFAPDSAHSQSLGSDLVLYPQVRHIYVLQLPNSLPVENVLSGLCVNGQHWFHCSKAQVAPQPVLHKQTLVTTVSRVSNTWQAFVAWQGSVDWDSTSFGTTRSQ